MQKTKTIHRPPLPVSLAISLLWLCIVAVFLLYTFYYYSYIYNSPLDIRKLYDFKLFYDGSYDYWQSGNLYQKVAVLPFERALDKNGNTPIGSLVFLLVSQFSLPVAGSLWVGLSTVLYWVGIGLISQVYKDKLPQQLHWRALLALLIYISYPVVEGTVLGTWGLMVAFLDFAAWYYARKGYDKRAGFFLGLAICTRWQPFTILLCFLALRRWRVLASSMITAGIGAVISLLVFGFSNWVDFVTMVFKLANNQINKLTNPHDGSIRGFLGRLFDALPNNGAGLDIYITLIWGVLAIILVGLAVWRCQKLPLDYAFSLMLVVGLLLPPTSWMHYHMALVLPLVVVGVARRNLWLVGYTLALWLSSNLAFSIEFEDSPLIFGALLTGNLLAFYIVLFRGPAKTPSTTEKELQPATALG